MNDINFKNLVMSQDLNITVAVRCRGRNKREIDQKSSIIVTVPDISGSNEVIINTTGDTGITAQLNSKTYTVDKVFGPSANQSLLFNEVAEPLFQDFIQGYNCTMLVYGMTSTGKTYTMTGDENLYNNSLSEKAGIIPRILFKLFDTLNFQDLDYIVKCSFVELYNEELKDLLDDSVDQFKKLRIFDSIPESKHNSPKLSQRNNPKKYNYKSKRKSITPTEMNDQTNNSIYIQNLQEFNITTAKDGISLLQKGLKHRQVATTKMNDFSSRSHTIFTISLYKQHHGELFRLSKMNLVDLAGSENISRSGALNQRAKEAGSINQSLLTLGRVINSLADKNSHIPFRESKLTRLLQDSLGGNTKTALIATVSPAKVTSEETCSTLEYASKAKNIKNKPQLGSFIMKDILLKNVTIELSKLKNDLLSTKSKDGVFMSQEHYKEMTHDMENYKTEIKESKRLIETLNQQISNLSNDKQRLHESLDLQTFKTQSLDESITNLQKKVENYNDSERKLNGKIESLDNITKNLNNQIETFQKRELSINTKFNLLLNDQLLLLKEKFLNELSSNNSESFEIKSYIDSLQKEVLLSLTSLESSLRDSYKSCIDDLLDTTPKLFQEINENVTKVKDMSISYHNEISENLSDISEEYNNLKQYLNDRFFQNNHKELLNSYINKTSNIMEKSSTNLVENVQNMIETYLQTNKQLLVESMTKTTDDIIDQEMKLFKPKRQKWETSIELINKSDSITNTFLNKITNSIDETKNIINTSNETINDSIIKINETFNDESHKEMHKQITSNKTINESIQNIMTETDLLRSSFKQSQSFTKESMNEINGLDKSIRTILNSMKQNKTNEMDNTTKLTNGDSEIKVQNNNGPLTVSSNNFNIIENEPTEGDDTRKRKLTDSNILKQSKIPRVE